MQVPTWKLIIIILPTGFGLSTDEKSLYLSDASGGIMDAMEYSRQFSDVYFSRDPAELTEWLYCI